MIQDLSAHSDAVKTQAFWNAMLCRWASHCLTFQRDAGYHTQPATEYYFPQGLDQSLVYNFSFSKKI
jgi:hypothetical protein